MNNPTKRYTFQITPIDEKDGGGYMIDYPSFYGCRTYGKTIEEAIVNGEKMVRECVEELKDSASLPRLGWSCP